MSLWHVTLTLLKQPIIVPPPLPWHYHTTNPDQNQRIILLFLLSPSNIKSATKTFILWLSIPQVFAPFIYPHASLRLSQHLPNWSSCLLFPIPSNTSPHTTVQEIFLNSNFKHLKFKNYIIIYFSVKYNLNFYPTVFLENLWFIFIVTIIINFSY